MVIGFMVLRICVCGLGVVVMWMVCVCVRVGRVVRERMVVRFSFFRDIFVIFCVNFLDD